jgi:hypothetical protein
MPEIESRWWDPRALLDEARAIKRTAADDAEFFCDPAYKPIREAIAAGEFALRRPWDKDWQVRPVPQSDQFPDVELRCGDDVRQLEIAEADRVNRRRCAEYRAAQGLPPCPEHFDPDEEAATALDEIGRVVGQKAAKLYSPPPHLLVYVNLSEGEPTPLYAWDLHEQFGPAFKSVWLLWQSGTFRLWPKPAKIKPGADRSA